MIRHAELEDVDNIYKILEIMHKESRHNVYQIDREKLKSFIQSMVVNDNKLCLLAINNSEIAGIFMAAIGEMYFSKCLASSDFVFFVSPKLRGNGVGTELAMNYVEWAKERGASDILLSTSTGISNESIMRISQKLSMGKIGDLYRL